MATLTITTLTPPAVIAALRADDWTTVDGAPAHEWLTRYWTARIRAVRPEPHDEEAHGALSALADALAIDDITSARDFVLDYRTFVGHPDNDGALPRALTRMMLETLLDWSQWTGACVIDDARAESWLRSLLS